MNTDPGLTWCSATAGKGAAFATRDPSRTAAREMIRMENMFDIRFWKGISNQKLKADGCTTNIRVILVASAR